MYEYKQLFSSCCYAVIQIVPGFPAVIPYFFTTLSTEKVNKIAQNRNLLFITLALTVSYSNVIRYAAC
ncbi:hypothetical protein E2R62_10980 [Citrobacter rodentium]|uniref:Uncharacterized protein n=1 Tax=Citrobacter rodentium TaxID=67825 RepID=A0A482PFS6_CITRO|nr:hypothetical protein E2R62_10980 [Citrobacter rodentium]HAT8013796.1 hypothetical protein [Citrobacter rodentium NBRC 105723 = DSM 16636]HAT8017535.1 hypothetical protein [Citrobacter rodentium]HAT8028536.1 hypothetical protein [Citrobacter rodentium]HAT8032339.1 hypothetical protein [Citrobacter rodentium]